MPIKRIGPNKPEKHPELVERLAAELRNPSEETNAGLPFIIEETINQGPALHVLVIWQEWKSVAMEDRGGVVMDAYENVKGREFTVNITMAMGLTYEEANRLEIGPAEITGRFRTA